MLRPRQASYTHTHTHTIKHWSVIYFKRTLATWLAIAVESLLQYPWLKPIPFISLKLQLPWLGWRTPYYNFMIITSRSQHVNICWVPAHAVHSSCMNWLQLHDWNPLASMPYEHLQLISHGTIINHQSPAILTNDRDKTWSQVVYSK